MVAEPRLIALICGWVVGVVDPAAIKTDPGDTVTLFVSVLDKVTLIPPDGAGVPSRIGNGSDCVTPMDRFVGRVIVPGRTTVTFIVVSGIKGGALAWITVVPGAIALITTAFEANELPSGKNPTVCCKSATLGLSELNVARNPSGGAADDSRNITTCEALAARVRFCGTNVKVAFTGTIWLADA
jgi:hypothetical protein